MAKNEYRLRDDGTIEIKLTRGKVAIVDAADLPVVAGYRWRAVKGAATWYAMTDAKVGRKMTTVLMHRLLVNPLPGFDTDHVDGNGLLNTRANVRMCTHAENARNQRIRSDNSSGFKGVGLTAEGRFYAQIQGNVRKIRIGTFKSAMNADRS